MKNFVSSKLIIYLSFILLVFVACNNKNNNVTSIGNKNVTSINNNIASIHNNIASTNNNNNNVPSTNNKDVTSTNISKSCQ